ncbi:tetratricopeptide repeat protein [Sphingomicrobium arenosum]|uniref:tetratricopeptide repeat protein n=1 Tax=Sphingomicrobium arenosum TaxID=2233861 RepID=UPI00223F2E7B|nr:hypothetical protein [Sphingomicrobium arenosum]
MKLIHVALIPLLCVAGAASAGKITLGGSQAESCYLAAEAGSSGAQDLQTCDRALVEDALSREDKASTHVNRGIILMNRADYAAAGRDFARALEIEPDQADAYLNAAILAMHEEDAARAVQLSTRSIELEPMKPHLAYYVRGIANEDIGEVSSAYRDLKAAAALAEPGWDEAARELTRYQVVGR